jgi:hypothetical protein
MAGGGSTAIQSILPSRYRPQLANRIEICRGSPFGSQSLTGIARLHRLRNNPKLAGVSAVWPFETGWAAKAKWLPAHVLILHAEIYPSVGDPLPDEIKDRVRSAPCGSGRATSIVTICSGTSFVGRSK